MSFSPEKYVYTIDGCEFKLAGKAYAVSKIQLSSTESSIPTAELIINPKPDANAEDVEVLKLSTMLDYISVIQSYANNPKGICEFKLALASESDSYHVQFEKWLLVDAGLSVGASGELACRVTMQHPIQAASNSTIVMMNSYTRNSGVSTVEGTDIAACIIAGLDRYLNQHTETGATIEPGDSEMSETAGTIDKYTMAKAKASVATLQDYVVWDYEAPMPFSAVSEFEYLFKGACVNPDNYIQEGLSPYHTMMAMMDELMIGTSGAFDDKPIKAFPREPWGKIKLAFKESELAALQLPKAAANLISGVAVLSTPETITYKETTDGNTDRASSVLDGNMAIRGGYVDKADKINGRLYVVNPPSFFGVFSRKEQGAVGVDGQPEANNDKIDTDGGRTAELDVPMLAWSESMRTAVRAWAHDYFWKVYRSNFAMMLRIKFMTEKDGVPVVPGQVCQLTDDDGITLYMCYIVSVTHVLDVPGRQAYTEIVGYYSRGKTGIVDVIDPGDIQESWIFNGETK